MPGKQQIHGIFGTVGKGTPSRFVPAGVERRGSSAGHTLWLGTLHWQKDPASCVAPSRGHDPDCVPECFTSVSLRCSIVSQRCTIVAICFTTSARSAGNGWNLQVLKQKAKTA